MKTARDYGRDAEIAKTEHLPAGSRAYEVAIYRGAILARFGGILFDRPGHNPKYIELMHDVLPIFATNLSEFSEDSIDNRARRVSEAIRDLIDEGSIIALPIADGIPEILTPLDLPSQVAA